MSNKQPPKISPTEGGVEPNRQSNDAQTHLPVTEASFRQGPFGEQLNALSADGSNTFGGKIGTQLTVAAYRQLEHNNLELKNELTQRCSQLDEARDEIADLKTKNATSRLQTRQLSRASWLMAGIYAIATVLISLGIDNIEQTHGKITFGLGCVCFLIGFFSPLILLPETDR